MPDHNGAPPGPDRTRTPDAMLTRAAGNLSSFDAEARTVDLVLATETPVRRRTWDVGVFDEILVVSPTSIDVSRLDSMGLLDGHNTHSGLDSRLGSIVPGSLRFEGKTAIVTAKISRNEKGEALFRDLEDGHVLPTSVGYRILTQTKTEAPAGGTAVIRATRWVPAELSIVSVGADPNASTRSDEGNPMPQTITTTTEDAPAPVEMSRAEINAEIRSIAKLSGLSTSFADAQIDALATIDQARAAAFEAMKTRSTSGINTAHAQVGTDHTSPEAIRGAMADALAHRLAPGAVKLEGRATEFRAHRVLDMVGDLALSRGDRFNVRDQDALLQRAVGAHSTSDFPLLLADAANKALLSQYQIAAPTYRSWAARKPFSDFKAHSFMRIGDVPAFKEVGESGSVKYGTVSENAEKVTAKEYTTGIAIGRRALVNDDLSALSDFSSGIAIRAANDENRLAYGVLLANGVMSDTKALFHADHGNLQTAAGFGAAAIGTTVSYLRKQKSLDGLPLNLSPAYLVVGPELEVAARQLLAAVTATKTADVNVWANFAELIVDANITDQSWYVFASPSTAPVIVYGYVGGSEGPQVRSERDFDTQAVKVAASLDFAVGAIDFRGAVKAPSA
jgi:phage major head subunit gpT-like protein